MKDYVNYFDKTSSQEEKERSKEIVDLRKQYKSIVEELNRVNERLKEINKKNVINTDDTFYYFYISRDDNKMKLTSSVYKHYVGQNKIIKSGCYFLSVEEVVQFVDDMEQSLFRINENRKQNNNIE